MEDVRTRLGVKSIRCRIKKRVLERIGHVLRMGNDRITKAVVLGWWEELEGREKKAGKKRKTVLYWKRLLREAGIDWTDIERIVEDRDGYRELVRERVGHIEKWDRQKGHKYVWEEGEESIGRSVSRDLDLVCRWEGCGKVCLSKGGLTLHQKRVHRAPEDRVRFRCDRCGINLETQAAKTNHEKTCSGGVETGEGGGRRQCGNCGGWVSRGNYARHLRSCRGGGAGRGEGLLGIGGSVRSAAVCSRRRTWRGTGRVVARSGTPEGDIGPDGAECRRKEGAKGGRDRLDGGGALTSDRKGWKEKVMERMEHLDRWERQKGHGYRWEQGEERLMRNVVREEGELVCRYEGCGKVCRNKVGLVMHEKRMHRVNEERGRLKCERCGRGFDAEGQMVSHVRSCRGGAYGGEGDRRQCGGCGRWVSRANYARHVRACGRVEAGGAVGGAGC